MELLSFVSLSYSPAFLSCSHLLDFKFQWLRCRCHIALMQVSCTDYLCNNDIYLFHFYWYILYWAVKMSWISSFFFYSFSYLSIILIFCFFSAYFSKIKFRYSENISFTFIIKLLSSFYFIVKVTKQFGLTINSAEYSFCFHIKFLCQPN